MRQTLATLRMILTMRCGAASALSSARLDRPLNLAERLALRGHLLACGSCRAFHRQVARLREAALRSGEAAGEPALPAAARARIAAALAAERGG